MNIVAIFKQNFFVLPAQGNFHYGPGYQEIKSVVTTFLTEAQGHDYQLVSTAQGSEFPSYLDHYRYEAKVAGHPENSTDPDFLFSIEKPDSLLSNTLGAKSILFSHTTLVVLPQ